MGKIGTIVLVHGQAETAFERSDVVFEEVGVFIEIDGFKGKFAESLAAVSIGAGV